MPRRRRALVVGLIGDLGSGKTTFVQGFAKGLGIRHRMVSPTFLIFRRYKIPPTPNFQPLTSFVVHMDAYRINGIKDLAPLHFKKLLADPRNLILIEWADQIKKALPKNTQWIHFSHGKHRKERHMHIDISI